MAKSVLAASFCWAVLGCTSEKPLPTFPVKGTVTVDGKPLTSGHVTLTSAATDKKIGLVSGTIDANGAYSVATNGQDGAPLGKYKVTVTPETMQMPGSDPKAKPMINRIYSDPTKTPLTIEVVESPAAGAYDLKLKK